MSFYIVKNNKRITVSAKDKLEARIKIMAMLHTFVQDTDIKKK